MNTFIGIKKLWYGDVLLSAANLTQAGIETLVAGMTPVENVHQDTWGYEETDPEISEYVNELTGQNYYVDETKQGIPTISFTLGEYQYQQKADLQGGAVIMESTTPVGWSRPTELNVIYKCIVALSKTGVYIIFPKAQITGKGDVQEKNIGLGVQAKAVETGVQNLAAEYWLKKGETTVTYAYTEVSQPTGNPHTSGYYVLDGDGYVLSNDTVVDSNKTYYTRSVVS